MPGIELIIPQLGEGLQEARIVRLLKKPGDAVEKDEVVFEMETDKAVMEIESPLAGVLQEWVVNEGDVLPIGTAVGYIQNGRDTSLDNNLLSSDSNVAVVRKPLHTNGVSFLAPESELRNRHISPRTRKYAAKKGISPLDLLQLSHTIGRRIEVSDLTNKTILESDSPLLPPYKDYVLSGRQRTLLYRLQRGTSLVVPASVETRISWDILQIIHKRWNPEVSNIRRPSRFLLFAWCVVKSARDHPKFRSALLSETSVREYENLHLGLAVSLPDDELIMARVASADMLDFGQFVLRAEDAMQRARNGEDQAGEAMQLSLTNMANTCIRSAVPVVTAPAIATLFLGTPYTEPVPDVENGFAFQQFANIVLTFDHRLINGIGASRFLNDIRKRIQKLPEELSAFLKHEDI
jgi:pyruvate dehydrogenase E2 component (dihydrolipoamide acetyltransferase)